MPSQMQPTRILGRSGVGTIAGVCAGLSEYFGVNLIVVRALMVILALFNGLGLIAYFILFLVMPASETTTIVVGKVAEESIKCSHPTNRWQRLVAWITGITGVVVVFTDLTEKVIQGVMVIVTALNSIPISLPSVQPELAQSSPTTGISASQGIKNGIYRIGQQSDTDPNLVLTEVQLTDERTKISLQYKNTDIAPQTITVFAPGDRHAFLIAAHDGTYVLPVRRVSGIILAPKGTIVRQGETVEFVLEFARIDAEMVTFHLIEGTVDEPDFNEWIFKDVVL